MVSSNLYGEKLMIQVLDGVRHSEEAVTVLDVVNFLIEKEPEKPKGVELKNLIRRTRVCLKKISDTGLINMQGELCKTKKIFYYKFSK